MSDMSIPELLMTPVFLLLGGGAALFLFNQFFRVFAMLSANEFAKTGGAVGKAIQPYLKQAKPVIEQLFGSKVWDGFKVDLTHIILAAILIVLIGIWRSTSNTNSSVNKHAVADADASTSTKGKKKSE